MEKKRVANQMDAHFARFSANLEASPQRLPHRVYAIVLRAGECDLSTEFQHTPEDFDSHLCHDIRLELAGKVGEVLTGFAEVELLPQIDLFVNMPTESFISTTFVGIL